MKLLLSDNGLNRVTGVIDVPMQQPTGTKLNSPASTPLVEEHLSDLVGLGPVALEDLHRCGLPDDFGQLQLRTCFGYEMMARLL